MSGFMTPMSFSGPESAVITLPPIDNKAAMHMARNMIALAYPDSCPLVLVGKGSDGPMVINMLVEDDCDLSALREWFPKIDYPETIQEGDDIWPARDLGFDGDRPILVISRTSIAVLDDCAERMTANPKVAFH